MFLAVYDRYREHWLLFDTTLYLVVAVLRTLDSFCRPCPIASFSSSGMFLVASVLGEPLAHGTLMTSRTVGLPTR